jgi:hypothetical protein
MNAERIHAIALSLQQEVDETHKLITELSTVLKAYTDEPTDAAAQNKLAQTRSQLDELLSRSIVNTFSPAWLEALRTFNVDQYLGGKLKAQIDKIFAANQLTPVVAYKELKTLADQVTSFSEATDDLVSGFAFYEIDDEKLEPGQCELGFLIPRKAVDNQLDELGEEFVDLNRILAPFSELASGSRPPINVRTISASDFGVFLDLTPDVAACVARGVSWIIESYKGILAIRKLRNQMLEKGVAADSLAGVDTHANCQMENTIADAVKGLLKEFGGNLEPGRKRELKVELTLSLNEIANRVDKGYNIEVRAEPPETSDATAGDGKAAQMAANYAAIAKAQENLKFIHQDGTPMLRLPTSVEQLRETTSESKEKPPEADAKDATSKKKRAAKKSPKKRTKRKAPKD